MDAALAHSRQKLVYWKGQRSHGVTSLGKRRRDLTEHYTVQEKSSYGRCHVARRLPFLGGPPGSCDRKYDAGPGARTRRCKRV